MWQKAHRLVLEVYSCTERFPDSEKFGLVNQLRRAAVSVPANIAEGWRRRTVADKRRFMNISHASLEESRYYLILATDLGYGRFPKEMALIQEVSKMLTSYSKKLAQRC